MVILCFFLFDCFVEQGFELAACCFPGEVEMYELLCVVGDGLPEVFVVEELYDGGCELSGVASEEYLAAVAGLEGVVGEGCCDAGDVHSHSFEEFVL